jgi:hypothetical protein
MRFQVPQFVDIEDRIIGPLTLKQFAFYMIAAMIIAIFYVLVDITLLVILSLPVLGVAMLFAHARFYGQSFSKVLINGINYFLGAKLYLWRRTDKNEQIKVTGPEYGGELVDYNTSSIDLMSQTLNTEGNIVESDVADPLLEEGEGSEGMSVSKRSTGNGTGSGSDEEV